MPVNPAKLQKLQEKQGQVRIGGKVSWFQRSILGGCEQILQFYKLTVEKYYSQHFQGTARRKKKVVHKTATDDKKLQSTLKKLGVNNIPGIEEVNMFKDDGNVLHFATPKVQASLQANTFAISGNCEDKREWWAWIRVNANMILYAYLNNLGPSILYHMIILY